MMIGAFATFAGLITVRGMAVGAWSTYQQPRSSCGNVSHGFTDYSGNIYYKLTSSAWETCSWTFDTDRDDVMLILNILYLELYFPLWSKITVPEGTLLSYDVSTPNYRAGETPWCGLYVKGGSGCPRGHRTSLCENAIAVSSSWPPAIILNATRITLSISYAFVICSSGGHHVDISTRAQQRAISTQAPSIAASTATTEVVTSDKLHSSTQIELVNRATSTTNANSTQNGQTSKSAYESALIACAVALGCVVLITITLTACLAFHRKTKSGAVRPAIAMTSSTQPAATYEIVAPVTTTSRASSNSQQGSDRSSAYQYIDLPSFHPPAAISPLSTVFTFDPRRDDVTTPRNSSRHDSDDVRHHPIPSVSSEFVDNEIYSWSD